MTSFFLDEKVSPLGFKIDMPLSSDLDAERCIYRLNIWNIDKWRFSQATGANDGKWTLTNSSFPLDEAMTPTEDSPVYVPYSQMYTNDEASLFRLGEEELTNTEIMIDRMKTNLILEGKLLPPPNRNYEGTLAPYFRLMAFMEEREGTRRRKVFGKTKKALQSRFAKDAPKGWAHLYAIISNGQRCHYGDGEFPLYHPNQRAYLLTRKFKDDKYIVSAIRNLSACSQSEIMKLLDGIEEEGRHDMIYVANQGEEIPYCFCSEDPEFLNWIGPLAN
ncbi:hypothetical protein FLONG3_7271 [Fusarium longipes]|uniref:Uncharacterized protein n=1 Tax=Fusarium longipes TaxID=694270 RepID=A0A395SF84_9HYPO|nr:hypothetical protein FLONG3_7271 [Fusarium longipes]